MTIALVGQGGTGGISGAGPKVLTYSAAAGDLLAVVGHYYNGGAGNCRPTSVTDSTGGLNTWHLSTSDTAGLSNVPPTEQVPANAASVAGMANFVAWSFLAASVTSITLDRQDDANGSAFWRAVAGEFSGVPPFYSSWAGNFTGELTFTAGPVAVPAAGSLVLAAVDALNGTVTGPGGGWTQFTGSGNSDMAYNLGLSGGPASAAWTSNLSDTWTGVLAVFGSRPGGGELGGRPPRQRRASYRFAQCKTSRIRPVLVT